MERRLVLGVGRWLNVGLLLLLPLLGLLGVFGERTGTERGAAEGLQVQARFPSLTRVSLEGRLEVELTPEEAGRHPGWVRVSSEGGRTVELPLKTRVLP